jgi:hypothetical protein
VRPDRFGEDFGNEARDARKPGFQIGQGEGFDAPLAVLNFENEPEGVEFNREPTFTARTQTNKNGRFLHSSSPHLGQLARGLRRLALALGDASTADTWPGLASVIGPGLGGLGETLKEAL